jgi:hypothetical protein
MINLIPNEEKKKKVKDFYFRLTVVFLTLLGVMMTMASVAILPAYFLSSVKKNLYNTKLETEKKEVSIQEDEATLSAISDLKNKLSLIESSKTKKYLISEEVINQILLKKTSDIKISGISYDFDASKGKTIKISGTASSRERLLLFKRTLEDGGTYKKVDLPISSFVKGTNINFSIVLTPA